MSWGYRRFFFVQLSYNKAGGEWQAPPPTSMRHFRSPIIDLYRRVEFALGKMMMAKWEPFSFQWETSNGTVNTK
jgi:hypothetical protein